MDRHFAQTLLVLIAIACPALRAEEAGGVTVDAAPAVAEKETPAQRDARMAWWREAKFGLFIHWGVYAVPAGSYKGNASYGEWIMHSAKIPAAEYQGFAARFNPVKYDPTAWVRAARDAGMRYLVINAKHHDGFALFPSQASSWNMAEATPYKKDLLASLAAAARADGMKIGFYYSQAQDWINPGGAKANYNEGDSWDPATKGSFDSYLTTVAVPQVRELLTRYQPDILWWDTPTWMNAKRSAPFSALLPLRPGIITNNRLGGGFGGDTATPEQFVPVTGVSGDWETCMTMNGHWGFNSADQNWKSSAELIRKLADICAKGGNFLLNIGPTAEGEFPVPCLERLKDMGVWLKANGESIYGTTVGPFRHLSWGCATRKADRLYLHVFTWPTDGKLRVPLTSGAKSAWLLGHPETKLALRAEPGRQIVSLPATAPDAINSVVVLELDGDPVAQPLASFGAKASATAAMPGNGPENVLDGTGHKRWLAPSETKEAVLTIELAQEAAISGIGFDEPDVWPRMHQAYRIEAQVGGDWKMVAEGKTRGHGGMLDVPAMTTRSLRITLANDKGAPGLAEVMVFRPE